MKVIPYDISEVDFQLKKINYKLPILLSNLTMTDGSYGSVSLLQSTSEEIKRASDTLNQSINNWDAMFKSQLIFSVNSAKDKHNNKSNSS